MYMSPVKEPHFFSPDALQNPAYHERVKGLDGYLRLLVGVTREIAVGEATVSVGQAVPSVDSREASYRTPRLSSGCVIRWMEPSRIIGPMSDSAGRGCPF